MAAATYMYELELHPHSGADAFVDAEIEAHHGDEDAARQRSTARASDGASTPPPVGRGGMACSCVAHSVLTNRTEEGRPIEASHAALALSVSETVGKSCPVSRGVGRLRGMRFVAGH